MILIADSGATKTDWCLGESPTSCQIIQTQGINPFHQSVDYIHQIIREELFSSLNKFSMGITQIYFYGAGCTPEKSVILQKILTDYFPQIEIEVNSDLLGAARSLCGKEKGIACILGSGSNSCFYENGQITANVSPLGFILGDEGSGAHLGKRLTSDCLKHQLPEHICQKFFAEVALTPSEIIDKVYRQPQANRFLASLTPFLNTYRKEPEIHALLLSCFTDFFRRNVMQYDFQQTEVHFTGSIAWYFQEEVKEAAQALNIRAGRFVKNPIHGLINYHL